MFVYRDELQGLLFHLLFIGKIRRWMRRHFSIESLVTTARDDSQAAGNARTEPRHVIEMSMRRNKLRDRFAGSERPRQFDCGLRLRGTSGQFEQGQMIAEFENCRSTGCDSPDTLGYGRRSGLRYSLRFRRVAH